MALIDVMCCMILLFLCCLRDQQQVIVSSIYVGRDLMDSRSDLFSLACLSGLF